MKVGLFCFSHSGTIELSRERRVDDQAGSRGLGAPLIDPRVGYNREKLDNGGGSASRAREVGGSRTSTGLALSVDQTPSYEPIKMVFRT